MDDSFWRQVERARRMTGDERVREGLALFEQGMNYVTDRIQSRLPEATPEEVRELRRAILVHLRAMGIT